MINGKKEKEEQKQNKKEEEQVGGLFGMILSLIHI